VAKDKPAVVTSAELNANGSTYSTSYALFDGLLRPVQTQAPAKTDSAGAVTGRTITDTFYDSSGRVFKTNAPYFNGNAPSSGVYDETRYGYDSAGRPTTVTDTAGNVWTTHYDLLSRKTKVDDPDKGTTSYTYTDLDQTASSQDARGKKLFYDYDVLGRQTAERADAPDGPKLAEWLYDKLTKPDGTTQDVFGQAVTAIRYADGDPDKAYRTDVTGYDNAYRPLGTRVTIPDAEGNGDLAGSYATTMTYNNDGSMATMKLPAAGGLAEETLKYGYDALGRPQTLKGTSTYVADTV
jgi:YD repeat-containing protein